MATSPFFNKEKLIEDLKVARMNVFYKDFVKNSVRVAVMMNVMTNIILFFIAAGWARDNGNYLVLLLIIPTFIFGFFIFLQFLLKTPEVRIIRSKKNIEAELISAIRFLILDLKANAPVFDSLQNLEKNFGEIGHYMRDTITRVKLGTPLEKALNEAVETVPSEDFRVLLWQLINHLQTGADITHSLETYVHEIEDKQKIEFKKYGKKLNVLSLFYMIIAIILPTIGFTLISAGLIFIGVPVDIWLILAFWCVFTVLQLIFLAMSSGNRPVVES